FRTIIIYNESPSTNIYTLSLHDALPIYFNSTNFANPKVPIPGKEQGKSRTYLHELSKLNRYIEFSPEYKPKKLQQENKKQLSILDRKSTRLNSSHVSISYAVFCLKKKNI